MLPARQRAAGKNNRRNPIMKQLSTVIWLNRRTQTASFHAVKGYEKHISDDILQFREMLQKLVDLGFRFQ